MVDFGQAGGSYEEEPKSSKPVSGPVSVEDLLVRFLEHEGERGPQLLDEICGAHPDLAEELRRRVQVLQELNLLRREPTENNRLGDCRLLRRLGGGGMGVVYLAVQENLGRRVALKIVNPQILYFPDAHQRFQREVLAAARLQHPGVARVFAVGEENALPYYIMEYVAGKTLTEVLTALADKPVEQLRGRDFEAAISQRKGHSFFKGSWTNVCLRVVLQVALALEHAHRRGVLHRDIKPSNIMITPNGRVLLVDFGLTATEDDERTAITKSGQQPGSLPYMSPEQLRGVPDNLDRRTDIYSLGVTLYQLLTLRGPFEAHTQTLTYRNVIENRFLNPRAINPSLRWEIETVCVTAMQGEKDLRYPIANAFARDLENLLERRPIEARRPGPILRFRYWVRRRPATAISTVLALILILGSPAVWAIQQTQANQKLSELNDELDESALAKEGLLLELREQLAEATRLENLANQNTIQAQTEARRSERLLDLVVRLFRMPDPVSGIGPKLPVTKLLEVAAKWAQEELHDEPDLQSELELILASIYLNLMLPDPALTLSLKAWNTRLDLFGEADLLVWRARRFMSASLRMLRRLDDATQHIDRTIENLAERGEEGRLEWALAIAERSYIRDQEGRYVESLADVDACLGVLGAYQKQSPLPYATHLSHRARLLRIQGKITPALEHAREALHLHEKALPTGSSKVAAARSFLAMVAMEDGKFREAERELRLALEQLARKKSPSPIQSINVRLRLAQCLLAEKRFHEAIPLIREAKELNRTDGFIDPEIAGTILILSARLNIQLGECKEAKVELEKAVEVTLREPGWGPQFLPEAYYYQAVLSYNMAEYKQTVKYCTKGIKVLESVYGVHTSQLLNILLLKGKALSQYGAHDDAVEAFKRCARIIEENQEGGNRMRPQLFQAQAMSRVRSGNASSALSDIQEAVRQFSSDLDEANPELLGSMYDHGRVLMSLARYREADRQFERVIEVSERHGLTSLTVGLCMRYLGVSALKANNRPVAVSRLKVTLEYFQQEQPYFQVHLIPSYYWYCLALLPEHPEVAKQACLAAQELMAEHPNQFKSWRASFDFIQGACLYGQGEKERGKSLMRNAYSEVASMMQKDYWRRTDFFSASMQELASEETAAEEVHEGGF